MRTDRTRGPAGFASALARTYERAPSAVVAGGVAVIAAALFVLRSPHLLTHPAFLEEETGGFWATTFARPALETLIIPWNGFMYVLPRAAFLAARVLPSQLAPLAPAGIYILTVALIAAFVASDRLADAIPDRRVRTFAGVGLVLLPFGETWVYATVLDVHFWLAIYLALLLVASVPSSRRFWLIDVIGSAVASFDGPASVFLAPLYLAQFRNRPAAALVVFAGAGAQVVTFATSARQAASLGDPVGVLVVAFGRALTSPLGDRLGYQVFGPQSLPLLVVSVVAVASFAAGSSLPVRTVAVLTYAGLAVAITGTLSQVNSLADLATPTDQGRYFIVAAWTVFLFGLAALRVGRSSGVLLLTFFIVGLASTARVTPIAGPSWECVGLPAPCVAASVVWPGSAATYRVPVGVERQGWIYPR